MCGIIGIASRKPVASRLYNALKRLDYRGYDSCGVALISQNSIEVRKDRGTVDDVNSRLHFSDMSGNVGIGHTRWATHGGVTRENSHPHVSGDGRIALIHNGIIRNYQSLRKELQSKGHVFRSETDTEVLVHLLSDTLNHGAEIEDALRVLIARTEGSFAIAFVTADNPDTVFAARRESPLVIGIGVSEHFIASDFNAFLPYTKKIVNIEDGEYVVLNADCYSIRNALSGETVLRRITNIDWEVEHSQRGGYPHFMTKEIHEQPGTVRTALAIEDKEICALTEMIEKCSKIYLVGVGTTYYVSMICQYYLAKLTGKYVPAISSDEFEHLAEIDDDTLVICFSQSGETYDTLRAIRYAKAGGASIAVILNVPGSTMSRESDLTILQRCGPEICVLSTKAAMSQIVIFLRTAIELARRLGFRTEADEATNALLKLPENIRGVLDEKQAFLRYIARRRHQVANWLFIGKSIYYAIALEAALKMKEVTYQHAEGIQGGFMKHGTIALIDDRFASLFFVPPSEDQELYRTTLSNAEEIRARGGLTVGFHFGETSFPFDEWVSLPEVPTFNAPLIQLVAGQLFAYFNAVSLKRDIDKPRSLAKSVTVE